MHNADMRIGYARVSTEDQNLIVQLDQLNAAGCRYIYREKRSAKEGSGRTILEQALHTMETRTDPGNLGRYEVYFQSDTPLTLVVTKLDRLARSTRELLEIVERIGKAGGSFVSLAEPWADTTSPAGKLIMTVFAGVAQFERERMLERCNAGRARAKREGVRFGRKPKLNEVQRRDIFARLDAGMSPKHIAHVFRVNASTIYRIKAGA